MIDKETIIYEDTHMLVIKKAAGIPSQSDKTGSSNMLELVRRYLNNNYVTVVQRLDRNVGGIMIFAKTKTSAAALSEAVRDGKLTKTYVAVVNGNAPEHASLTDFLFKNERLNISRVVGKGEKHAKEAILAYDCLERKTVNGELLSFLRINLKTGRHHQIRVQLSNAGLPIWGDIKYNPNFSHKAGCIQFVHIALWAYGLELSHPKTGDIMSFIQPPHNRYPFNLFNDCP